MVNRSYTIIRIFGAVLLLILIGHGSTAQALAVPSILNVEPVLFEEMTGVTKKKCAKCAKMKSLVRFHKKANTKDGLCSQCKECRKKEDKEYYEINKEKIKTQVSKYRLVNIDKIREYNKRYREDNREATMQYSRRWRADNREKIKEYAKEWRLNNAEEHRERAREYRKANPGKHTEYCRIWNKANPEKGKTYRRKRRAIKRGVSEQFTDKQAKFVRSFWGNQCVVCGRSEKEEGRALSIDHWHPLSKGNPLAISNAVLLCQSHNSQKHTREPMEVFDDITFCRIEQKIELQVKTYERNERCIKSDIQHHP